MKRTDIKKEGGYEANYNAGWVRTDESTTEFRGTRAEADVIVAALELLIAERKKMAILGIQTSVTGEDGSGSAYYRSQTARPEDVLKSIREPNYDAAVELA